MKLEDGDKAEEVGTEFGTSLAQALGDSAEGQTSFRNSLHAVADALAATVVGNWHGWWTRFVEAAGDARRCGLYDAYAGQCVTLGRDVGVSAPGGSYNGHAQGIDEHGRLLVDVQAATRAVDAADVTLA